MRAKINSLKFYKVGNQNKYYFW